MIAGLLSPGSLKLGVRGIHAMGNPRDFHRNPTSPDKSFSTCVRNTICCWPQASCHVPPFKTPRQNPILPKTEHANLICAAISCNFADAERWRDGSLLTCLTTAGGGVLESAHKPVRCWSHDKQERNQQRPEKNMQIVGSWQETGVSREKSTPACEENAIPA